MGFFHVQLVVQVQIWTSPQFVVHHVMMPLIKEQVKVDTWTGSVLPTVFLTIQNPYRDGLVRLVVEN